MKHMSRNDALARLMDIAGSDWDLSSSIQENLVSKSNWSLPIIDALRWEVRGTRTMSVQLQKDISQTWISVTFTTSVQME